MHTMVAGAGGILALAAMTIAMLPSSAPVARHVYRNSLTRRRLRAVAEFVLGYAAVWTAFGMLAMLAVTRSHVPLAAALVLAAAWQLVPLHRYAIRGCHRTVALPATGWRAEVAALRFGVQSGGWCVAACWCLMVVMCAAPGAQAAWAAVIGTGVFIEKTSTRPGHVARIGGLVLATIALFATVS